MYPIDSSIKIIDIGTIKIFFKNTIIHILKLLNPKSIILVFIVQPIDIAFTINTIIATGSKGNLNINILIPMLLEILDVEMDQREVETIRRDLYAMKDGELVTPL